MPSLRRTHQVGPAGEDGRPKLDIAGAVALTVAALPLLLALSLGHAEGTPITTGWLWISWQTFSLLGLSLAGGIAFVMIERRAASPIVDLELFKIRTFAIGSLAAFVVGGSFLGAIVFLPLFMVNVAGVSSTGAGLTTTPLTFGLVAANVLSGQLVSRLGSYKGLLLGSLLILIAGFAIVALTLEPTASQGSVTVKMILIGIGLGPSIPLFMLAIQNAVPPHQIGVATASATFARQLGATIGIAIVGTVFASTLASGMHAGPAVKMRLLEETGGGEGGQAMFDAARIKQQADARIDQMPTTERMRAVAKQQAHTVIDQMDRTFKKAFTDAIVNVSWVSLAIAALGFLITLLLPRLPLRKGGERPPAATE